jgi:23S rRNA C2498 (ribose-2'-O)-methylase RlmM
MAKLSYAESLVLVFVAVIVALYLFTRAAINNQELRTNVPKNNKSRNIGKFVRDILLKIRGLIRRKGRSRNPRNIKRSVNGIDISVGFFRLGFFRFKRYSETEYFGPFQKEEDAIKNCSNKP